MASPRSRRPHFAIRQTADVRPRTTRRTDFVHFGRPARIVLRQCGSRGATTRGPGVARATSASASRFLKEVPDFADSNHCAPRLGLLWTRLLSRWNANYAPRRLSRKTAYFSCFITRVHNRVHDIITSPG